MKMKQVAAVVLTVVLGLSAFAGCAPATNDAPESSVDVGSVVPSEDAVVDPTEEAPVDSEVLVMVTNAEFPPFEYVTDEANGVVGEFAGVDVAIAKAIADSLGKELKIQNMEFTSVLLAIPQGKADFAAAGITANDERRESMDFSDPYYVATQYIIVAEDNADIASAADLMDKAVGVVETYTGEMICRDMGIANLTSFKRGVEAVNELKNGKLDAVVIDSHTALALIAANADVALKYVADADAFETEEYAIAVQKGNTELLDAINEVLAQLKADGTIDVFVATYTQAAGMEDAAE